MKWTIALQPRRYRYRSWADERHRAEFDSWRLDLNTLPVGYKEVQNALASTTDDPVSTSWLIGYDVSEIYQHNWLIINGFRGMITTQQLAALLQRQLDKRYFIEAGLSDNYQPVREAAPEPAGIMPIGQIISAFGEQLTRQLS